MASPVIDNVLEAVKTTVASLGLTAGGVTIPVVKRKLPMKEESIDPSTQIVVSMAEVLPAPVRFCAAMLLYRLPVEVTLITPNRSDYVQSIPDLSNYYGSIRDKFAATSTTKQTFPITIPAGADAIWMVKPDSGAFLDRPRLNFAYDYQQQVVSVFLLTRTR